MYQPAWSELVRNLPGSFQSSLTQSGEPLREGQTNDFFARYFPSATSSQVQKRFPESSLPLLCRAKQSLLSDAYCSMASPCCLRLFLQLDERAVSRA